MITKIFEIFSAIVCYLFIGVSVSMAIWAPNFTKGYQLWVITKILKII